jgi:hypothetical protein
MYEVIFEERMSSEWWKVLKGEAPGENYFKKSDILSTDSKFLLLLLSFVVHNMKKF